MKKYKLIKEYPGSPRLGSIIEKTGVGHGLIYELKLHPGKCQVFTKCEIENYTEFWEEVAEKDYEILSYQSKNKIIAPATSFAIEISKSEYWDIHSVKRLSDGEIFTVGDSIKNNSYLKNHGNITKFFLKDEIIFTEFYEGIHKLENVSHIKKPLFTTKDGVDIFKGDNVHWVCDEFTYFYTINIDETHCNLINSAKTGTFKIFPTKETAEKYILMNKSCLSLNDVFKIYPRYTEHAEDLIKIVKSKL